MVKLPNGCLCSELSVNPKNWKTVRASVIKPWYIQYRFYDPSQKGTPNYKKFVIVKGMNEFPDLRARQQATSQILAHLERLLKVEGYNPIMEKVVTPLNGPQIIDPLLPLIPALRKASELVSTGKAETVKRDLRGIVATIEKAVVQLRFADLSISDVSRKHIKLILDQVQVIRKSDSAHRYNKFRTHLMMLFAELVELEAIEDNPVKSIKKKKGLKKIRPVLSHEERKRVDLFLQSNYYSFWRFMQLFFHSGARLTELVSLQVKDVDIPAQVFKLTIKKGSESKEVLKPIKDIVRNLWEEAIEGAKDSDYVFSRGLIPGPLKIQSYQITKRWYRLVKSKIGIQADFYSLKHLNLDETAEILTIGDAAAMASHTSTVITMKHYATGEEKRQLDKLKKVKNKFA
jgi:integrase